MSALEQATIAHREQFADDCGDGGYPWGALKRSDRKRYMRAIQSAINSLWNKFDDQADHTFPKSEYAPSAGHWAVKGNMMLKYGLCGGEYITAAVWNNERKAFFCSSTNTRLNVTAYADPQDLTSTRLEDL